MPVPDNQVTKVLVLPEIALDKAAEKNITVVKLIHPKTEEPTCFLYNPHINKLFELLSFNEDHRCWFLGARVIPDGSLQLSTPISPLLLALPYLAKASKLVPLDQVLEDDRCPSTDSVLLPCLPPSLLSLVADRKGDEDLNVWKFQEDKALEWLHQKVTKITSVLKTQKVDLSGGATSLNYKTEEGSEVEYQRIALGIIEEYLPKDMADKLVNKLGLPEEKVNKQAGGQKRLSSEGGDSTPKAKRAKVEALEDYSKNDVKSAIKEEQSAKQKALAQAAKGTKSISSFFSRK